MATELQLTVDEIEVKTQTPLYTEAWEGEIYDLFVNIKGTAHDILNEGIPVYFRTPMGAKTVSTAPGISIVLYRLNGEIRKWLTEVNGDECAATPGQKNKNTVEPNIKAGDVITIRATVELKFSRAGNRYYKASRVKLLFVNVEEVK